MGFRLFSSNQLNALAGRFDREVYRGRSSDPFAPEIVVVQTAGMGIYLQQFLAAGENAGICANLKTPFLDAFIDAALPELLPESERTGFRRDRELFSREVMTWSINELLRNGAGNYPELKPYLTDADADHAALKCYQLSERIAGLFDRYQVHRPEKLLAWAGGTKEEDRDDWQRRLYLELNRTLNGHGREYYFARALNASRCCNRGGLPDHVALFGIGTMPRSYLAFFRKLSEIIDVYLFYLNPCADYWSRLLSARERAQRLETAPDTAGSDDFDCGNPLLAELGRQGRDFFEATLEVVGRTGLPGEEEFAAYVPPGTAGSMLTRLQEDILTMADRSAPDSPLTPTEPGDISLSVHNCHGPRREVEVLCDQLLLATRELGLEPCDIIVMAPDINLYAPLIDSVFGASPFAGAFSISDRSLEALSSAATALLDLLQLADSRCEAERLLELISCEAIAAKFGFEERDLAVIESFLRTGGIRWGEDAENRREFCRVAYPEFSWREGLDRLMLGFAVEEDDLSPLPAPAPAGSVSENERAGLLGRFIHLVNRIFLFRREFRRSHPVPEWCDLLNSAMDFLFADNERFAGELQELRKMSDQLRSAAARAGFRGDIPAAVIRDRLKNALQVPPANQPFLRGNLTFCSLVPMRSIPARVVAIIGLNDGEFPRRDLRLDFDLMDIHLPGDRSRPDEDRYLFLEALLAARDRLLLFYSGQSPTGNPDRPPAAPLAEVIDYLKCETGFELVRHRLQPYAADYFEPGSPAAFRSYRQNDCLVACELNQKGMNPTDSTLAALAFEAPDHEAPGEISLERFTAALTLPLREFLMTHTPISGWPERRNTVADDEDFALSRDVTAAIGRNSLTPESCPAEALYNDLNRRRQLPAGRLGRGLFDNTRQQFDLIPPEFRSDYSATVTQVLSFAFDDRLFTGSATGDPEYSSLTQWIFQPAYERDLIRLRIMHLALTIQRGAPLVRPSRLVSLTGSHPEIIELAPIAPADAAAEFRKLLELWLQSRRRILPFFPKASWVWARYTGDGSKAMEAAIRRFSEGTNPEQSERNHPAIRRFFSPESFNHPEFRREFIRLAALLLRPYLTPARLREAEAAEGIVR